MPLPKGLARFNRVVTNKIARPFARRLPGFGALRHIGRKSGEEYETPLNVWRDGARLVVALTYGQDVDWLKNARRSGSAEVVVGGEVIDVGAPVSLTQAEGMSVMPAPVRMMLSAIGVSEFVAFPIL